MAIVFPKITAAVAAVMSRGGTKKQSFIMAAVRTAATDCSRTTTEILRRMITVQATTSVLRLPKRMLSFATQSASESTPLLSSPLLQLFPFSASTVAVGAERRVPQLQQCAFASSTSRSSYNTSSSSSSSESSESESDYYTDSDGHCDDYVSSRAAYDSRYRLPSAVVGNPAPHFVADAVMPDGSVQKVTLQSLLLHGGPELDISSVHSRSNSSSTAVPSSASTVNSGNNSPLLCLIFYPLDFTFVCPSELLAFNRAKAAFDERYVHLASISVDSVFTHQAWRRTPPSAGGVGPLGFPMLADPTHRISKAYSVFCHRGHSIACALRGLFIIDASLLVRHATINDLPLGRSVDETLRIVDALRHHQVHGDVCPANWQKGRPAMEASQSGVASYLGSNYA